MKKQLFFVPFAGGSAHSFDVLLPYLQEEFEVHTFEYAGHGSRRKEPFYANLQEAAKDAALFVNEKRNGQPYAIFGYSMGSLVVYEMLVLSLLSDYPAHIFLASHDSPDSYFEGKTYHGLDESKFIEILRNMGGMDRVDEKTLENRFFKKLYLEPIKEDYRLLAEYQMSGRIKFKSDATIFYAPADITRERIECWIPFLTQNSKLIEMGERHFFLESHAGQLTDQIKMDMHKACPVR